MRPQTDDGGGGGAAIDAAWVATPAGTTLAGRAYAWPLRTLTGALVAAAGAGLLFLFVALVRGTEPPLTPRLSLLLALLLGALPWGVARALARAAAAALAIEGGALVIQGRRLRVEAPLDAIARIAPWRIPLPGPGLALTMRSGAPLGWGLQLAEPAALLAALDAAGVAPAGAAARHPLVAWARARSTATRPWRWQHYVFKFVVYGALPAAVLFNLHQWITYGGTLGQYYLEGLQPYLATLASIWITTALHLTLFAAMLRAVAEAACMPLTVAMPARATRVRRLAELACAIAYYGGVPLLLGIRFLA